MVDIYKLLFEGREQDSQRFWVIFNLMSVINGALLGFVISGNNPQIMRIIISVFGVAMCIVWYGVQRRMNGWIVWWEVKLREFEPLLMEDLNADRVKKKLGPMKENHPIFLNRKGVVHEGISSKVTGWLMPVLFISTWVIILAVSVASLSVWNLPAPVPTPMAPTAAAPTLTP